MAYRLGRFLLQGRAAVSLLFVAAVAGAQPAPHLDGRIETDPASGVVRGDLCVSRVPPRKEQVFLLNRGLNIREVRDRVSGEVFGYEGFYNAVNEGDATRYTIEGDVGADGFCVSYVGAYPVYQVDAGERAVADWKGRVAFDGRTMRASEQTRLYPVVVDPATGAPLDKVSFTLDVTCTGCRSIFVNGSTPQPGPKATFSSDRARPLLLYAGDFPYRSAGGVHFVGAPITAEDAEAIRSGIRTVAQTHASFTGVPYRDEPVYLTFASVARHHELGVPSWQFVTWPTIAMSGRIPFAQLLREKEGRRVFHPGRGTIHEMAHYYFGTLYAPRGPLLWFLLESTAEYLALKAQRALAGEEAYASGLRTHLEQAAAAGEVTPLDEVDDPDQIGQYYRYSLGPLLLIGLEDDVGQEVVRKTLAGLITDPPAGEVAYADLRERLLAVGATEAGLVAFEDRCLHRSVASGCLSRLTPDE